MCFLSEQRRKVGSRHAGFFGQLIEGEIFMQMLLHNKNTAFYNIIHSFFHIIENSKAESAQKTIKPEVRIQQVFYIIHQVKVVHDVLKLRYTANQRWSGQILVIWFLLFGSCYLVLAIWFLKFRSHT